MQMFMAMCDVQHTERDMVRTQHRLPFENLPHAMMVSAVHAMQNMDTSCMVHMEWRQSIIERHKAVV